MKNNAYILSALATMTVLFSCQDKKLTEVVEVPLPTAQEKVSIGFPEDVKAAQGSFQVEKLEYNYDALAPTVSPLTLETHYSKHYLTYTNDLNKAIAGTPYENQSIENILAKLDLKDTELRNNAGGYYNHSLYWKSMAPDTGGVAIDTLAGVIKRDFGSFSNFENAFKNEATSQFGSAWTFLVVDKYGKLKITSTQNQDNPLMRNAVVPGTPILALDLWEHAYYLGYQYRRKNYIDSFFTVINWEKINANYEAAMRKKY
ncbi:Fe-Mn family superoxide dismutase [Flavobacterium sp. 7E]|uniref:superoxide dismutase n=1 Tax=unclassified Flavobacterium TaxID=196869 RepID=UPI001570897B|nr:MULTISPECIES: superoxide dismutase [unclassified Flavobacterium]MBE0392225.1 Superoxide dismutase [Flavobacterium sp. PL002]NRS88281.1 Fe-Mn family superoxide dismutase [Flavobacterium sp. 7E]NRT15538.1 Fe-Mn family superoxide dismutase [Flavobacterium sp. 28A]